MLSSRLKNRRLMLARHGCLAATLAAAFLMVAGGGGVAQASAGSAARSVSSSRVLAGAVPAAGACNTAGLKAAVHLANVTVVSATLNTSGAFTVPTSPPLSDTPGTTFTGLPGFCAVSVTQTDSAGNPLHDVIWLPSGWNRRFMGAGGSGYTCGIGYAELASAIQSRYATASTDCGVGANPLDGTFALTKGNTLNTALIQDFSSAGIHDMTVVGKAVTDAYYTKAPSFSYFNGCSTGGREGLMEAQRYPTDYNGIVSGAPAINWTKFIPAEIWPELVMNENHDFLPSCKEQAFDDAVTAACGGTDGVIQNPDQCDWSPYQLVGLQTPCGTITRTDAAVVTKIWQGATSTDGKKLWYGLEPGAPFDGLAATTTSSAGVTTGDPFQIAVQYLGYWLLQNPSWDWRTLTYSQFDQLFNQSVKEYANVIATDDPNLSQFEQHGGKIVIWHGLADQLIFPQGTVNYYQRVEDTMGTSGTYSFARLFLAPGAQHCGQGAGPAPDNPSQSDSASGSPLAAVVNWVEHGTAPASILATKVDTTTNVVTQSRPLCAYPAQAHYTGHGNPNTAFSYSCASR